MYIPGITGLSAGAAHDTLCLLRSDYEKYRAFNLKLDIQRGRPCAEQLDISSALLDWDGAPYTGQDGNDVRNYGGGIEGAPEARDLIAEILGVKRGNVIVCGNSSLTIMYDLIVKALLFGVYGSDKSWLDQARETGGKLKFLCPAPGYDRHFLITETLGFEMLNIEMRKDGPDMDAVERLVSADPMIKGMWNIPKYSNPTGVTYSAEVVRRFAALKPKAGDFRLFWDNAYIAHDLYDETDDLLCLLAEADRRGNGDIAYMFASTSKVTFAGAGITALAASENNIKHIAKQMSVQTICPDKINQVRHARFIRDAAGLKAIMKKHAAIVRPKFERVLKILSEEFHGGAVNGSDTDICEWTNPRGGYFINLDAPDGCAKTALRLAAEAGVKFTPAGATYPYGIDPRDRSVRIAPTVPTIGELDTAIRVLALCVQIAYLERR